jgi:hypothetical protein
MIVLCIHCCPLVEEEGCHLSVTTANRYEVKGEEFRVRVQNQG